MFKKFWVFLRILETYFKVSVENYFLKEAVQIQKQKPKTEML